MARVSVQVLKTVRLVHLYFGVFIAPALLFFAFTGFVQTFSLHETTRGSSYLPPRILVELGQLHKKQTLVVPEKKPVAPRVEKPAGGMASQPAPSPASPAAKVQNLWPMKLFFALVAVGLVSSTFSGLYMAYRYGRSPAVITGLWVAGILVPVLFTLL